MRICNNLAAMNTYRQYSISGTNVSGSVQKLSSGQRINSAADDSAGLAISEKMQAQIRGLNQASKNSQDGMSLLQTAEGALNETHGILQRMRELAVQSSSDTNDGSVDRAALDQEFQQLKNEVNDIANKTQFNGINLLKGMTGGPTAANATGLAAGITVSADSTASAGTINIATVIGVPGAAGTGSANLVWPVEIGISSATATGSTAAGSAYNGTYYLKATGPNMSSMTFSLVDGGGSTVVSTGAISVIAGGNETLYFGNYGCMDVTFGDSTNSNLLQSYLDGTSDSALNYTISGGVDAVPSPAWDAGTGTAGTGSANLVWPVEIGISSATAAGSTAAGSAYNGTYYLKATGPNMSSMTFSLVDGGGSTVVSTGAMSVIAGGNETLYFGNYGCMDVTFGDSTNSILLQSYLDGTSDSALNYTISGGIDAVASATIGGQLVTEGDSSVTLATGITMDISSLDASDWASPDALNTALFGSTTGSASVDVTAGTPGLTIQTGANAGDTLNIAIGAMDATTIGIGSSDIASRDNASSAITTVNSAINKVSTQRAGIGAYQNRLEHKISNLDTSAENLQAAESRIRDVDIAQEMMKYTKNNILVQAATAMLAQANSAPQNVLKLLQ